MLLLFMQSGGCKKAAYSSGDLLTKPLGGDRYLVVNTFGDGKLKVHVRQFERRKTGVLYPTKAGVYFQPARYAKLMALEPQITSTIQAELDGEDCESIKWHIGGGVYVAVSKDFDIANLRQYFLPEDEQEILPTKVGVTLKLDQWENTVNELKALKEKFPELANAQECDLSADHANQTGYYDCKECSPFGTLTTSN